MKLNLFLLSLIKRHDLQAFLLHQSSFLNIEFFFRLMKEKLSIIRQRQSQRLIAMMMMIMIMIMVVIMIIRMIMMMTMMMMIMMMMVG